MREKTNPRSMMDKRSCMKKARAELSFSTTYCIHTYIIIKGFSFNLLLLKFIITSGASFCLQTMSEVSLATSARQSSWNGSEKRSRRGAPRRPVVARCSIMA